jgi:hypothetical protein
MTADFLCDAIAGRCNLRSLKSEETWTTTLKRSYSKQLDET